MENLVVAVLFSLNILYNGHNYLDKGFLKICTEIFGIKTDGKEA